MTPVYLPPHVRRAPWTALTLAARDAAIILVAIMGAVLMLAAWAA